MGKRRERFELWTRGTKRIPEVLAKFVSLEFLRGMVFVVSFSVCCLLLFIVRKLCDGLRRWAEHPSRLALSSIKCANYQAENLYYSINNEASRRAGADPKKNSLECGQHLSI